MRFPPLGRIGRITPEMMEESRKEDKPRIRVWNPPTWLMVVFVALMLYLIQVVDVWKW